MTNPQYINQKIYREIHSGPEDFKPLTPRRVLDQYMVTLTQPKNLTGSYASKNLTLEGHPNIILGTD